MLLTILLIALAAFAVYWYMSRRQPAPKPQDTGQNTGRQPLPAPQDPYGGMQNPYGLYGYGPGPGGPGGSYDPNVAAGFQFGGQVVKSVGDVFKAWFSREDD